MLKSILTPKPLSRLPLTSRVPPTITPFYTYTLRRPYSQSQPPPQPSESSSNPSTHTGIKNQKESSIYSSEQTRSATSTEIVQEDSRAAFDPEITNPMEEKRSAGIEQSTGPGNPLEYSAVTPEVNKQSRDDSPDKGNKSRDGLSSGGSKKA